MFHSIELRENVLQIRVLSARASDEEFDALLRDAEAIYANMDEEFYLVFDLCDMGLLPLHQAMKWMELFDRVKHVTETHLICTSVCLSDPLVKGAVDIFLGLYNPTRPLYTFPTLSECEATIRDDQALRSIARG